MDYRRFARIAGIIVVVLLIVLFIILIRFSKTDEESILNFTFSACDNRIDTTNQSELGIKEIKWLNNKTFFVMAHARFNCAEEIIAGGVEKDGEVITLSYRSPVCWPNTACADCYCVRTLIFTYGGIDKTNYDFDLKRIG